MSGSRMPEQQQMPEGAYGTRQETDRQKGHGPPALPVGPTNGRLQRHSSRRDEVPRVSVTAARRSSPVRRPQSHASVLPSGATVIPRRPPAAPGAPRPQPQGGSQWTEENPSPTILRRTVTRCQGHQGVWTQRTHGWLWAGHRRKLQPAKLRGLGRARGPGRWSGGGGRGTGRNAVRPGREPGMGRPLRTPP